MRTLDSTGRAKDMYRSKLFQCWDPCNCQHHDAPSHIHAPSAPEEHAARRHCTDVLADGGWIRLGLELELRLFSCRAAVRVRALV